MFLLIIFNIMVMLQFPIYKYTVKIYINNSPVVISNVLTKNIHIPKPVEIVSSLMLIVIVTYLIFVKFYFA